MSRRTWQLMLREEAEAATTSFREARELWQRRVSASLRQRGQRGQRDRETRGSAALPAPLPRPAGLSAIP